ncbi:MAG: redoxin family protein [Salinigranum sp.]
MDAHGRRRRDLLCGGAAVAAAALAGCAGFAGGPATGTDPSSTDAGTPADAGGAHEEALGGAAGPSARASAGAPTTSPDAPAGRPDAPAASPDGPAASGGSLAPNDILLPSVDVGDGPRGLLPLRKPGRVVLLDFFATWCPPCGPEMANLLAARERFDRERVYVLSITQESDEGAIRAFWERHGATWPVVMDPGLRSARRYAVTSFPTIVVLAPDGTRVMRHRGLTGERRIVAALETALER